MANGSAFMQTMKSEPIYQVGNLKRYKWDKLLREGKRKYPEVKLTLFNLFKYPFSLNISTSAKIYSVHGSIGPTAAILLSQQHSEDKNGTIEHRVEQRTEPSESYSPNAIWPYNVRCNLLRLVSAT